MDDVLKYVHSDAARGSIQVTTHADTVNGSGVDLAGYDGAVAVAILGAAWTSGMGSYALSLEESADNSTFSAPASNHVVGTAITISGQGIGRAVVGQRYVGSKRYLRVVGTHTGGTTNCDFGAIIVRMLKRHET